MKNHKLILFFVSFLFSALSGLNGAEPQLRFLVGEYRVVGVHPDSQDTYQGTCTMKIEGGKLIMRRKIGAQKIVAVCGLESTAAGDATVLRARFTMRDVEYEITYLIGGDLDNYARLSGDFYRKDGTSKTRGLETLFHIVRQEGQQDNADQPTTAPESKAE